MDMEFGNSTKASQEDINLADAPRVILDPIHEEITASIPMTTGSEALQEFTFETESTTEQAAALPNPTESYPHHRTALVAAVGAVLIFSAGLLTLYILR